LAALLVAGIAAWLWWQSDRRQIERRLDGLERACEKSGDGGALSLLGRSQTILESFAPGFVVSARPYAGTISDGRELLGVIEGYRALSESVRIRHGDQSLDIRRNGTAEMTLVFAVDGRRGGSPAGTRFRARIFWVRGEKGWQIHDFEVTEVLEGRELLLG